MKTKLFLFSICAVLFSVGASAKIKDGKALMGNSLSDFGSYTIVQSDAPLAVEGKTIETYDLLYENTRNPIRIGILEERESTTFLVKSDEFEIQYKCGNGVFGVKKLEPRFQELPAEANEAKLNRVNYLAQRVICRSNKSDKELMGLIACYLPNLVNQEYQASF